MKFRLLGQLEIVANDEDSYLLGRSKISQMLGLLLVHNMGTVSVERLIEELWGEKVPRSALTTLQTYVYHARKLFAKMPGGEKILTTRPSGYALDVPADAIDVKVFESLVGQARELLGAGHLDAALQRLDEAFQLWRGQFLAGVTIGPVLDAHVTYMNELRFAATELRIEACHRLGRYQELVPQLRLLVAENPLNESLHAQLIRALRKCGRRAEALEAYRNLWRILDTELGVEPAAEVQSLQQDLLVS